MRGGRRQPQHLRRGRPATGPADGMRRSDHGGETAGCLPSGIHLVEQRLLHLPRGQLPRRLVHRQATRDSAAPPLRPLSVELAVSRRLPPACCRPRQPRCAGWPGSSGRPLRGPGPRGIRRTPATVSHLFGCPRRRGGSRVRPARRRTGMGAARLSPGSRCRTGQRTSRWSPSTRCGGAVSAAAAAGGRVGPAHAPAAGGRLCKTAESARVSCGAMQTRRCARA